MLIDNKRKQKTDMRISLNTFENSEFTFANVFLLMKLHKHIINVAKYR
jgi:hypothetical protein